MKLQLQQIFNEFVDESFSVSYHPSNPVDSIKARLTAAWLLQHEDQAVVESAKAFIRKTALNPEADLSYLAQLAAEVKMWYSLEICSTYLNMDGLSVEYKLSYIAQDGTSKNVHLHALFELRDRACYFISEKAPLIRVIGDPILHQSGTLFPESPTAEQKQELARQIELAKTILVETGGGGIAANQCALIAQPFRFTIVGVFHDNPRHVANVDKRYPNVTFPEAQVMINPVVVQMSEETQTFNHACLSVPCSNRCAVKSPTELTVAYQDTDMQKKTVTSKGMGAIVLWHELKHILEGKTYIDVTLEALAPAYLSQFKKSVQNELSRRNEPKQADHIPVLTVPPFYVSVKIDEHGVLELDSKVFNGALRNMAIDTLNGLLTQANLVLKKKGILTNESLAGLKRLSLHAAATELSSDGKTDAERATLSKL